MWLLLNETTQSKNAKDVHPLLGGQLLRSVVTNGSYPVALYHAVLTRVRAGDEICKAKAAFIKAYLQKNARDKEVATVALNNETDNKPYAMGRLFAVLEHLQMRASDSDLNTTIRDRYFTRACANPATVFPTLLKLSINHSRKLESSTYFEKLKTELLGKLDVENPFPQALPLDDQGRFILGYYHQTQVFYTPKSEREEESNDQ